VEAGQQQQVPAGRSSPLKNAFNMLCGGARRAASLLTTGLHLQGTTAAATGAGNQPAPGAAGARAGAPAVAAGVAVAGPSTGGVASTAAAEPAALGHQQAGAKRAADAAAAGKAPKRACKSGVDRKPTACSHCKKEGHNIRSCPERKK
jgi:hypothetical protein